MDKVGKLYHNYQILSDSVVKASEHEAEYLEIIQAAKGDKSEKNLACQFIPNFLGKFPHLAKTALDAQLDLVEDEDVSIRKMAIKYLPVYCKHSNDFIKKVSDILTQLLQSEDNTEINAVHTALRAVLKMDAISAFNGILLQITTTDDMDVRRKAADFLVSEFNQLSDDIVTRNVEEHVLETCRNAFRKLDRQDFLSLLPVLFNLKITKTILVKKTIVATIADQINFDAEFNISAGNIADFMECVENAKRLFSQFVTAFDYVYYICMKILPKMDEVIALENGSELFLGILKLLAEISQFGTENYKTKECTEVVYNHVLKYIPLPPEIDDKNGSKLDKNYLELDETDSELDKNGSVLAENYWQFTYIECFLFTFGQLLKYNSDFITAENNLSRFKDLKLRLQFLARCMPNTLKNFQEAAEISESDVKSKEAKMKSNVYCVLKNISALIKEFFRCPPTFESTISLSWKRSGISCSRLSVKRGSETSSSDRKREKRAGRELYVPPTGKYSSRVNFSFDEGTTTSKERGRHFY